MEQDAAPSGGRWGGCIVAAVVVVVVGGLLTLAGFWIYHKVTGLPLFSATGCTVNASGSSSGTVSLDLDQAQNASTIAAVGIKNGVPGYGIEVAEATAIQESKLVNISYGDRDSLGLFQQRPSEGWGTATQIMDPVYSSTAFYSALLKISGWQQMSVTDAAQAVQNSGDPNAYAAHVTEASVLASVFSGATGAGVTCTLDNPSFPTQTKSPSALLTARGQTLLDTMRYQFGDSNVGTVTGIAANGLSFNVSVPGSVTGTQATQLAWAYANWSAAQAEYLGVAQVDCGGSSWTDTSGTHGWSSSSSSTAAAAGSDPVAISMVTGG
ncbi:MAG TPA: hypothetical protein VGM10_17680 [Actinocrinis sp.]|jgi:hypothetical protein